jgi:hypothetical protein
LTVGVGLGPANAMMEMGHGEHDAELIPQLEQEAQQRHGVRSARDSDGNALSRPNQPLLANVLKNALLHDLRLKYCGIIVAVMYRKANLQSLRRRAGTSVLLGFTVFVLGALVEYLLSRFNASGVSAFLDDLLIGVLAGVVVFGYESHRHKMIVRQMRVIADMNHHVRNALQPILYSPYLKEQAEQVRMIQQGTERIQWALREVLHGNFDDPPPQSSRNVA